jgi:mRNA-degrading endonuclease YafQ of YafQ-DinJ toxin-antitoxin module
MELIFKNKFKRNSINLIRWNNKLKCRINNCILDFSKNIFNSSFYRKPLKNLWNNIYELEIWWDIRILIELFIVENKCYFLNIWTHSSLNLTWNKKVNI